MSVGNGGIHLLGRKPSDKGADLCTKAEAQAIADKLIQYYMNQIPGLVAHMLAEAFKAHGLVLQPPLAEPESPMETTAP